MIYLELFLAFLKVGCFSFGGYAAIPIVRESVLAHAWMDEARFADLIALSESSPGPIMVNLATYVGSVQGGFLGALIATAAVVLPAFVIVLILMKIMKNALKNKGLQASVDAIKPCVVGLIFATGVYMLFKNILGGFPPQAVDFKALGLCAVLALIYFGAKKIFKNGISPILLIFLSAAAGVLLYGV
ncbi:MAG: chromate transporter [Clostridia bacterium]|nr:chromate transporter [Clostridia bacterium]